MSNLEHLKELFRSLGLKGVRCFACKNFHSMPTLVLDFPDEHFWALPQLERAFLSEGIFVSGYAEFNGGYLFNSSTKRHMIILNKE